MSKTWLITEFGAYGILGNLNMGYFDEEDTKKILMHCGYYGHYWAYNEEKGIYMILNEDKKKIEEISKSEYEKRFKI